jgi:hypothetical protein
MALGRELVPLGLASSGAGVKTLVASRVCDASARDAWRALRWFNWWVTPEYVVAHDADDLGNSIDHVLDRPLSLVYEGLPVRGRITALEPDRHMAVSVSWRRFLRAEFSYEILADPKGCKLMHTRSYRGAVTRLLASVWAAREQEDQSALLHDWCWVAGENAALRRYAS